VSIDPHKPENRLLVVLDHRDIIRKVRDCRRNSTVSSLQWSEMKYHHRFTELQRHRLPSSLYIAISIVSNSRRQVMRLVVGVLGDVAVLAGNVTDARRRRFRFADNRLRRHVAIDVHDIQSSIYVECSVDHRAKRLSDDGDG
jgi:hypothetical protein